MHGRIPRWLSAVAVLPLLVLALSAPLSAVRCRLTGMVVAMSCCCPDAERDVGSSQDRQLRAQDCCTLEKRDALRPASELPGSGPRLEVPIVAALALAVDGPIAPVPPPQVRDGGAQLPRPPLLLVKRSFLI